MSSKPKAVPRPGLLEEGAETADLAEGHSDVRAESPPTFAGPEGGTVDVEGDISRRLSIPGKN